MNTLFYGDNLDVLRQHIATESVDLIYLDPPFNSNRSYNVLFKAKRARSPRRRLKLSTTPGIGRSIPRRSTRACSGGAPIKAADAIEAMHGLLGPNDVLAYLVMMTARLVELHRVLKPTGSLYLHCDPTASHYLKVMLDAIFGPSNFRNEIIWKRTTAHNDAKGWTVKSTTCSSSLGKADKLTWIQAAVHIAHEHSFVAAKDKFRSPSRTVDRLERTKLGARTHVRYVTYCVAKGSSRRRRG